MRVRSMSLLEKDTPTFLFQETRENRFYQSRQRWDCIAIDYMRHNIEFRGTHTLRAKTSSGHHNPDGETLAHKPGYGARVASQDELNAFRGGLERCTLFVEFN